MTEDSDFYSDKVILVTGGAGSIGAALVRRLLAFDPRVVRVYDNNETALFDLEQQVPIDKIRSFIGDVRDKERLARAMENVDIVFHAAALKHVPLCEFNPFDAVKTNILGTQNVLDAALDEEVEKVIVISTDKAVNPTSVMGTTKLLAERLTVSSNYYKGVRRSAFSCVRFGNVLGSRGSVVPLFRQQIADGMPVTVTDPRMTRFIMSIPKAVDLILTAGRMARGGEIFILKMPAIRIHDLAEVMVEEFGPHAGAEAECPRVVTVGRRVGERIHEELMTSDEAAHAYESDNLFLILPEYHYPAPLAEKSIPPGFTRSRRRKYSTQDRETKILARDEIHSLFSEVECGSSHGRH